MPGLEPWKDTRAVTRRTCTRRARTPSPGRTDPARLGLLGDPFRSTARSRRPGNSLVQISYGARPARFLHGSYFRTYRTHPLSVFVNGPVIRVDSRPTP